MTEAQARVLEALLLATKDGWPATVRDVMEGAGLSSPSTALAHLEALERRGLVEHRRHRAGWRPTALAERKPTAAVSCYP